MSSSSFSYYARGIEEIGVAFFCILPAPVLYFV